VPNLVNAGIVIGYGSIGRRHTENLLALVPQLDLTVVTRRDDVRTNRFRVVRDLARALADRPQFAVVASDSAKHAQHVLDLLEAGVPAYVEKPAVTDFDQLERVRLALAGTKAAPITFAGCNMRHLPSLVKLRALLRDGAIGRPVRATLQAGAWLPDWRPGRDYRSGYAASAHGGGVVLDLVHELDQARWLFGEFDDVAAVADRVSGLDVQAEDCACIVLRRRGRGPLVMVGLDYVARVPVRRYEIIGDEATLVWDLHAKRLERVAAGARRDYDCGASAFDMGETYVEAMREFLEAVSGGGATSQPLDDGLASAELALRARAAAGCA
jgi:predicted dehydrogenase